MSSDNQNKSPETPSISSIGTMLDWDKGTQKKEVDEKRVHFDTRQYSIVTWSEEGIPNFTNRLALRIEATIGRGPR